jgi:F0F1-type ATP synthase epsilon subunit
MAVLSNARPKSAHLAAHGARVSALVHALAETLAALHAAHVVVGDLNDANVLMCPTAGQAVGPRTRAVTGAQHGEQIRLVDADSMQFGSFPCTVAHERFVDPRLFGADFSTGPFDTASDWYALCVLWFQSLAGVHPYGGTHPKYATLVRRAEARHSVLRGDVTLARRNEPLHALAPELRAFFEATFDGDRRGPPPFSLLRLAPFVTASLGATQVRTGPVVAREQAARMPVHLAAGSHTAHSGVGSVERVVHATAEGELVAYDGTGPIVAVWRTGDVLTRSDGSVWEGRDVTAVVLDGRSTYFGTRIAGSAEQGGVGRVYVQTDGTTRTHPTDVAYDEATFAVAGGILYVVEDGWIVVADTGARIGRVAERHTFLRGSASTVLMHDGRGRQGLLAGFFRAGPLVRAFVCAPASEGFRTVAVPLLGARIVDADVAFGEREALLTVWAEGRDGHRVGGAFLLDARGDLVAAHVGDPEVDPLVRSVRGRCLVDQVVVVGTPSGLATFRADRATGTFLPSRTFPQTSGLMDGDGDLRAGPGGSVFVGSGATLAEIRLV